MPTLIPLIPKKRSLIMTKLSDKDNADGDETQRSKSFSYDDVISKNSSEDERSSSSQVAENRPNNETKQKNRVRRLEDIENASSTSSSTAGMNQQEAHLDKDARSSRFPSAQSTKVVSKIISIFQKLTAEEEEVRNLRDEVQHRKNKINEQQETIRRHEQRIMECKKANDDMQKTLQSQYKISHDLTESNQKLEHEKDLAHEKLNNLIRTQQLESFKRIDASDWTPKEDSQVQTDLDNLKRLMRNVSKEYAVTDFPSNLGDDAQCNHFILKMKEVIQWTGREDPFVGMSKNKRAAIMLNAMVAHEVYTRVIAPAFSYNDDPSNGENTLARIYETAKKSDEADAHSWRAQTLRLLYPQVGQDAAAGAKNLHNMTESKIYHAALVKAKQFMHWTATLLVKPELAAEALEKFCNIFIQAAVLSYELWTRKSALRVITLAEISLDACFQLNSPYMVAHTLVKYNDDEEEMNGRPIRMVVNPLLEVWGTDEGSNYNKSRVLMPFEVWMS